MNQPTRPRATAQPVTAQPVTAQPAANHLSAVRDRGETGAASAEYAAMTAAGVGLASVLIKLLTSDFGRQLLEMLIEFFLKMIGIG